MKTLKFHKVSNFQNVKQRQFHLHLCVVNNEHENVSVSRQIPFSRVTLNKILFQAIVLWYAKKNIKRGRH